MNSSFSPFLETPGPNNEECLQSDWVKLLEFQGAENLVDGSGKHHQCKTADIRLRQFEWDQFCTNLTSKQWSMLLATSNPSAKLSAPMNHWRDDLSMKGNCGPFYQNVGTRDKCCKYKKKWRCCNYDWRSGVTLKQFHERMILWKLALMWELLPGLDGET